MLWFPTLFPDHSITYFFETISLSFSELSKILQWCIFFFWISPFYLPKMFHSLFPNSSILSSGNFFPFFKAASFFYETVLVSLPETVPFFFRNFFNLFFWAAFFLFENSYYFSYQFLSFLLKRFPSLFPNCSFFDSASIFFSLETVGADSEFLFHQRSWSDAFIWTALFIR